jgi:hypothetical protein
MQSNATDVLRGETLRIEMHVTSLAIRIIASRSVTSHSHTETMKEKRVLRSAMLATIWNRRITDRPAYKWKPHPKSIMAG